MNRSENIIIFNAKTAKVLLHKGFNIIDIAPHRHIKNGTIFIFKNTSELRKVLKDDLNIIINY